MAREREPLDHTPSLFEHASRLHESTPDRPLPEGGLPYPEGVTAHERCDHSIPPARHRAALLATLEGFFTGPDRSPRALHDAIAALPAPPYPLDSLALDGPPWPAHDRARETGLWLIRHATDGLAARIGLCLLSGRALPEDIPLIRTLGLLRGFGTPAVAVLEGIPGGASAIVWLARRSSGRPRTDAVAALCRLRDPAGLPWLLRHATDDRGMVGSYARQVAEAVCLADVLEGDHLDDEVVVSAGRLLQALLSSQDYTLQLHEYGDACRAFTGFAVQAGRAAPALDLLAAAVTLAEDLRTGHAACLPWAPGARAAVLDRLERLIASGRWTETLSQAMASSDAMTRWRAAWAARAMGRRPPELPPADRGAPNRFAVHVVAPDPVLGEQVETRLLVDGRPVVAEAFRKGPPYGPEYLLKRLEAGPEPRDVRLAEAYCTEGCCGALYVTIARDGDTVTWSDWRDPDGTVPLEPFRFEARQYSEAVEQALRDRGWEWPARSVARELNRLLGDDPGLLGRWRCETGGVSARTGEQDHIRMYFWHPRYIPEPEGEPWLQFEWIIPMDGTPPADQAARLVRQLREIDPKSEAEVVGGSREHADSLGFPWPC